MKDCLTCKYDNGSSSCEPYEHPCCECNDHDKFEEYIGENLYTNNMKQYPIDRQTFQELFAEIEKRFVNEGIFECETCNFKYWKYEDEFYILHKDSGTLVNWYKHLGRCNTCNKRLSLEEYKKFVKDFLIESGE